MFTGLYMLNSGLANNELDWVVTHAEEARKKLILQAKASLEARLSKIREKERRERQRREGGQAYSKRAVGNRNLPYEQWLNNGTEDRQRSFRDE